MALSAAKQSGDCCKVVAKINRKSLLELVSTESLIDSVVSTGAVTTELILQYIRAMKNASASKVKTLHRIVDEKVEALEFSVTPDISFAGVPLRDLNLNGASTGQVSCGRTGRSSSPPAMMSCTSTTM